MHWENEDRRIDGIAVWTATRGVFALSIEAFVDDLGRPHRPDVPWEDAESAPRKLLPSVTGARAQ